MTLILVIVLVLLLAGGGYGWRAGYYGASDPLGIILIVILLVLVFGLVRGPHWGWW
jgi:hypothetical protein